MIFTWSTPGAFAAPLPTLDPAMWPGHAHDWVTHEAVVGVPVVLTGHQPAPVVPAPAAGLAMLALLAIRTRRIHTRQEQQ